MTNELPRLRIFYFYLFILITIRIKSRSLQFFGPSICVKSSRLRSRVHQKCYPFSTVYRARRTLAWTVRAAASDGVGGGAEKRVS